MIHSDDLRDFWWVSCRMARLQYGAKYPQKVKPPEYGARTSQTTDTTDDRQTDGFAVPLVKRNVVTFG